MNVTFYSLLFFLVFTLPVKAHILKNDFIRFETDGKHITSLYDSIRNVEHIASDYTATKGFFSVSYVPETNFTTSTLIEASALTSTLITSSNTALEFKLENTDVIVYVKYILHPSSAEISSEIRIELKNREFFVCQVDFPRFRTLKLHNDVFKEFVNPLWEGRKQSVETAWSSFVQFYPYKQAIQMSAILSDVAGALLWTNDTKGHVKSFGFQNNGATSVNMAVRHCMPYESSKWESTYQTMIALCDNNWEDAAEIYRDWATKQTWSATLLKNRTDVPANLHNSPLVISSQVDMENLSDLPSQLNLWAEKYNTQVIYRPLGWEKYGNWTGIDYFPSRIGDQNFLNLNNQLKSNNITTSGFIEGFHWVWNLTDGTSETNTTLQSYFADNKGNDLCRTQKNGTLYEAKESVRQVYFLCRGTNRGKTFLLDVAKGLFDRGITNIHNDYDHLMGGDGPCFNKSHGHPIPYGTWETDLMIKTYHDIIQEAKIREIKNFSLTKEWPCEIFNMILNGYQARNWKIVSSQKNQIPLFLYVYHDYIPAIYGLNTANATKDAELCASIIYGQINSIAFWKTTVKSPSTTINNVLQDYYESLKINSKDFLLYGRLLKSIVSANSGAIQNTWQDDKGNIAVFAIDTLETNIVLTLKVPSGMKYMNIYTGSTLNSAVQVTPGENYSWNIPKWRLCSAVFSQVPLAIKKNIYDHKITVLLNRAEKKLRINTEENIVQCAMELFDMYGKVIISSNNESEMSLLNITNGIYCLRVRSLSHNDFVYKFILV